jgi:hypothetical protein
MGIGWFLQRHPKLTPFNAKSFLESSEWEGFCFQYFDVQKLVNFSQKKIAK